MELLTEGLVISHLGQGIAVEADNKLFLCQTKRKLDTVAVGDKVLFTVVGAEQGRIETIQPRRSVLLRPGRNAQNRPVAANLDQILVVFAPEPACDFLLIDQYLAICENRNIDAVLVLNKLDLTAVEQLEPELQHYQALGYRLLRVSAMLGIGLDELGQTLNRQVSLFVGQSGVGKSSLTNAVLPEQAARTNTVSATTKHGRHTTTAATLYHLPCGGDLIDSPGVAIFGLAELSPQQLAWGFRDFQPLLEHCRFKDCRHWHDKDCAVRGAAEQGNIPMSRYLRYLKLREKMPTA